RRWAMPAPRAGVARAFPRTRIEGSGGAGIIPPVCLPSAYTCGAWRVEFRCSLRARFVGRRCAATDDPQLALLFYMLQGSLQKIDFQDLLPDLTFQLRDSRLLRPFLAYAGKRPLPKLIDIAAPAVQFLAAHFQAARH